MFQRLPPHAASLFPDLQMRIRLYRRTLLVVLSLLVLAAAAPAAARDTRSVELVVTLRTPSLSAAANHDRALASVTMLRSRLQLDSPASVAYLALLRRQQNAVTARIRAAILGAYIHWRYSVTLDGLAVVVPRNAAGTLARVPGVAKVWPTATYHASLDSTPQLIGAPAVWGSTLATAGQGIKIGIIDEGVDQTHPFFSPAGFTMPAGFPKGDPAYTTAKVIVARAFPPPSPAYVNAGLPFDPSFSEHGTHVAGIAAGDHGTNAPAFASQPLSGIAPAAYIGNYKALTIPTPCCGLDGNAPEIAKAIDQAVADGMDVINLSLGEPEIDPSRDIVVKAINGAARAGVVPCIAAGNEGGSLGEGSIGSPGAASLAITAAASTTPRDGSTPDIVADFSSIGPTPYSLQLKPDVTAPGVGVLSSVPGSWGEFSGTSMAAPHVAGAAAVLKQRHPSWTVAQVKSALMLTGDAAYADDEQSKEATPLREGGGRIYLPRADTPLVFASPSSLSFGLLKPGTTKTISIALADAGGGAGAWTVSAGQALGARVTAPASVSVPGTLVVKAAIPAKARQSDGTGFLVLTHGTDVRRIPYWLYVERPKLGKPAQTLSKTGTYSGDTRKGRASVNSYRFPQPVSGTPLAGPEQVFGVPLKRTVANFGVRIVSQARGVKVTPLVVRDGDENRLTGYVGFPGNLNPYLGSLDQAEPVAGAVLPGRGTYDVVFDTTSKANAGKFTFRFWINDVTPPGVKLLGYSGGVVRLSVRDTGAGVDPNSLDGFIDDQEAAVTFSKGVASVTTGTLAAGKHTVEFFASDYQEVKNMEDVLRILPNTRGVSATFTVP
jgi:subtilisin family serine protease